MEPQKWEGLDNDGNILHDEPDRSTDARMADHQAALDAERVQSQQWKEAFERQADDVAYLKGQIIKGNLELGKRDAQLATLQAQAKQLDRTLADVYQQRDGLQAQLAAAPGLSPETALDPMIEGDIEAWKQAAECSEARLNSVLDQIPTEHISLNETAAITIRGLQAQAEIGTRQIAELQAQLRQVEHDAETYRKMHTVCTMNLALANNELTTLRQLVSALPVVDVQEVSVWLSPDESGWLVSKRPAFPAGLYWAKFRTQAEADSFRALLAYRATLAAQIEEGE